MKTHTSIKTILNILLLSTSFLTGLAANPSDLLALSIPVTSAISTAAGDSITSSATLRNETAVTSRQIPVEVTAEDFITKVYGVFSPERSKEELCTDCKNILELLPEEDRMGLWLDSTEGYQISYYGQTIPDVSAMATIERDSVAGYGFFFLFPYEVSSREEMNARQAAFCGSLLQEMQDIGVVLGENQMADALFEVSGDYKGSMVDVRLIDEGRTDGSGRFVLYLRVDRKA